MDIDIICPLYNAESSLKELIFSLSMQKNIHINKLILPVTESNDKTYDLAKKFTKNVFEVEKKDFSHSLIREKAMSMATSDVVIMLTQDVVLDDDNCLYKLASAINDKIVFAFARQITKYNNIEKYIREKNYPSESYVVSKEDIEKMQIKAFFCSDACSAYNRKIFAILNGYDNKVLPTNEDMYYARKILLNGYMMKYCADATVLHSHNFSLKEIYHRYYTTGLFFKENKQFDEYKTVNSGFSLSLYVLKRAFREFNIPVIFRWLPDMMARYFGMKKGKKE